jgi:hypothetical protein
VKIEPDETMTKRAAENEIHGRIFLIFLSEK